MVLRVVSELCSCLCFISAVNFVPWIYHGGEPHRLSDFKLTSVRCVKKRNKADLNRSCKSNIFLLLLLLGLLSGLLSSQCTVFTSREKSGNGNQFRSGGSVNKRRENVKVFEEGRKTTTWRFSKIKKQNNAGKKKSTIVVFVGWSTVWRKTDKLIPTHTYHRAWFFFIHTPSLRRTHVVPSSVHRTLSCVLSLPRTHR